MTPAGTPDAVGPHAVGSPTGQGRRPKLRREELRSLLLAAGRSLLQQEGLGTGAEVLTFKRVFARVEADTGIRLTNASVIKRVWDNQADFQADVLVALAADQGAFEIERTLAAVAPLVGTTDTASPGARWHALGQFIRVGGAANQEALSGSDNWSTWLGVWAVTGARVAHPVHERVATALVDRYRYVTARYESVYRAMIELLGFRLREGLTLRQFTIMAGALSEGYAMRGRIDVTARQDVTRPTGPDGEPQEWVLYAVALEGLARRFFELDPGWSPPPPEDPSA